MGDRDPTDPWVGICRDQVGHQVRERLVDAAQDSAVERGAGKRGDDRLRHRLDVHGTIELRSAERFADCNLAIQADDEAMELVKARRPRHCPAQQEWIERRHRRVGLHPESQAVPRHGRTKWSKDRRLQDIAPTEPWKADICPIKQSHEQLSGPRRPGSKHLPPSDLAPPDRTKW